LSRPTAFEDIRGLLLDLDGTLCDSVPDLAFSIDAMLARLGRSPAGEAAVRDWVGNGVATLVARALAASGAPPADTESHSEALAIFSQIYRAHNGRRSRLYPGVAATLARFSNNDLRLACVTNKPREFTLDLLAELGIRALFSVVVAGDDARARKPDPAPLELAMARLELGRRQCLFVGDSVHDVEAARAAGVAVICVPYGYNHGVDIGEAHPDAVVESFSDLRRFVDRRH